LKEHINQYRWLGATFIVLGIYLVGGNI